VNLFFLLKTGLNFGKDLQNSILLKIFENVAFLTAGSFLVLSCKTCQFFDVFGNNRNWWSSDSGRFPSKNRKRWFFDSELVSEPEPLVVLKNQITTPTLNPIAVSGLNIIVT